MTTWRARHRALCRAVAAAPAVVLAVALAPVIGVALSATVPATALATVSSVQRNVLTVPVGPEPDGSAVTLDAELTLPSTDGPHPAVLLAHGFGGTRADLSAQARDLAGRGYVVLAYSARGFGASGGRVHLNDPDYEIADARALVDLLAQRPEVRGDGAGDPRVGVAGGSYGGALALMLAGSDRRVDAVAALITWHDLADAFFPQSAVGPARPGTPAGSEPLGPPGPFKQLWASRFYLSAVGGQGGPGGGAPSVPQAGAAGLCGRFDPSVCALLRAAAETGVPSPELVALLGRHSPAPTLSRVTAPTLLVQGMADSLFGLEHADATARALAAAGTPLAVRWTDGGHDRPSTREEADEDAVAEWLDGYLMPVSRPEALPVPGFVYPTSPPPRTRSSQLLSLPVYPGLRGGMATRWTELPLAQAGARPVLTPPGGEPASVTVLPGLAGLGALDENDLPTYPLAALPGQSAAFDTAPATTRHTVVGSPRVRLRVTSSGPATTLFVSLWQVRGPTAGQSHRLVAPLQLAVRPGVPADATVALPAATYAVERGDVWRVLVTSTDAGFASPREARFDRVELVGGLALPTAGGAAAPVSAPRDTEAWGVAVALAGVLTALAGAAVVRRMRARNAALSTEGDPASAPPLVVEGLQKSFTDGHRAVDVISFRAQRGQVVGLLGPNGAGKTTTMRIVMGLLYADGGTVRVLGEPVTPGAAVLARVGALVEGPGFLPHLTGRENLAAYWAATGRAADEAHLEEAVLVAALGDALDRPVRSYSHGMRQRLGIAQAMLGLPEVLVLDEPTNGLDPPQIAAMRPILREYAAAGRTVLVSSHLLAEVELTCSHVVVMHAGRVIAAGSVTDLLDSADTTVAELDPATDDAEAETLAARLRDRDGVVSVLLETGPRLVVVSTLSRSEVVRGLVEAGAAVTGISGRRHLEEVFLGAIAAAQDGRGDGRSALSLGERLRQVRPR